MKKRKSLSDQHKVLIALIFITIGVIIGLSLSPHDVKEVYSIVRLEGDKEVSMNIVAINNNNEGVSSKLTTRVRPGNGLVLLNINDILADYNSQYSSRIAAKVASDYANMSLDNIDVIYNIAANATVIEGSSAGSAMAISTIAALQNKPLNPGVVITGSIKQEGTLGGVGAVREKAMAAKEAGASIMLVPEGSLRDEVNYKQEKSCTTYNNIRYCEIKYIPEPATDLSKELGIKVIEVADVKEALGYFYSSNQL